MIGNLQPESILHTTQAGSRFRPTVFLDDSDPDQMLDLRDSKQTKSCLPEVYDTRVWDDREGKYERNQVGQYLIRILANTLYAIFRFEHRRVLAGARLDIKAC